MVILAMYMPHNCKECELRTSTVCPNTTNYLMATDIIPDNCPIQGEISDPHGRLLGVDVLATKWIFAEEDHVVIERD